MSPSSRRAWIKFLGAWVAVEGKLSPSSRRAWIKIPWMRAKYPALKSPLLAEGVDRNDVEVTGFDQHEVSPSSRRAWIEM